MNKEFFIGAMDLSAELIGTRRVNNGQYFVCIPRNGLAQEILDSFTKTSASTLHGDIVPAVFLRTQHYTLAEKATFVTQMKYCEQYRFILQSQRIGKIRLTIRFKEQV